MQPVSHRYTWRFLPCPYIKEQVAVMIVKRLPLISLSVSSLGPQLVMCFGRLQNLEELKPYWEICHGSRCWGIRGWPHFLSVLFLHTPDAMWPTASCFSCHTFLPPWTVSTQKYIPQSDFPLKLFLVRMLSQKWENYTMVALWGLFCKNINSIHSSNPVTSSPLIISTLTMKLQHVNLRDTNSHTTTLPNSHSSFR